MNANPKFTWGNSVIVDGDRRGSVCAVSGGDNGFAYTVEFADGSDELIAEDRLESVDNSND